MLRSFNAANYPKNIRILMPGGICGTSQTNLDPFCYCTTPRNDPNDRPTPSGQQCYDFEQVYWNRFTEPATQNNQKIIFHPYWKPSLQID